MSRGGGGGGGGGGRGAQELVMAIVTEATVFRILYSVYATCL